MKKTILIAATAVSLTALFAFKSDEPASWSVDNAHTKVGFSTTHLMVSDVEGYFKKVTATIKTSKMDFSDAVAEMTAQVNSVFTDNEQRDGHLQSPDFFDAAKFPTITFKSTSFKKGTGNNYTVTGNLTMHGVTKPVTLNAMARIAENPMSKKTTAGFKITGKINRKDFGIGASIPSEMVGEEIDLIINAEFIKE
jgi:polyisoprenoid-binding protein YceI